MVDPLEIASPLRFPELTRDEVFRLGTRRLWLRWPTRDDRAAIAAFAGDERVAPRTATWPVGISPEATSAKIAATRARNASGEGLAFAVELRAAPGIVIGQIGGSLQGRGVLGLGYHFAPEHWNQGYAGEAVAQYLDAAFRIVPIARVEAAVQPDNDRSRRVLERAGFSPQGQRTYATVRGDERLDLFTLSRAQWRAHVRWYSRRAPVYRYAGATLGTVGTVLPEGSHGPACHLAGKAGE
jgi:RimJ/RimL family protein N-acetyltransferase